MLFRSHRVEAERAVRALMQARRADLSAAPAPPSLKARCAELASRKAAVVPFPVHAPAAAASRPGAWRARLAPVALAASVVLAAGGLLLYQATRSSARVLAAELTADHEKCVGLNAVLGTNHTPDTVEAAMLSGFGWSMRLPDTSPGSDVALVGSRWCLYGEGKAAHIMFRHRGEPVSLFMLPGETRTAEQVEVLGHRARIWSEGDRTFVLLAGQSEQGLDQMAALVRTTVR